MRGFRAPPPGTPMCRFLVTWESDGRLDKARHCRRKAQDGTSYCGLHAKMVTDIETSDGGWCVFCAKPGRTYTCDRVSLALCASHQKALTRALLSPSS